MSEDNLYQSLHTVLVLNRDFTGSLARIWKITSSGKNPCFTEFITIHQFLNRKQSTIWDSQMGKSIEKVWDSLTRWKFRDGYSVKSHFEASKSKSGAFTFGLSFFFDSFNVLFIQYFFSLINEFWESLRSSVLFKKIGFGLPEFFLGKICKVRERERERERERNERICE